MAKGLESVEHLERSGKFNRARTTSELVLDKTQEPEPGRRVDYPYPRSNTAADMRDESIVYPQPQRSSTNLPTARSGSRTRSHAPSMTRQHSYSRSEFSDTQSERPYTFVPSLLNKLRNGIKPTEVTCGSRASSRMSQDTHVGTSHSYAWSEGGGQWTVGGPAPSVTFSAKSDFDQEAIERYAQVRSKAELPSSIPSKDSPADFVVAGEVYSYDGECQWSGWGSGIG